MITVREFAFRLLLNSVVQVALFAGVAALFGPLLAKARPRNQFGFYLAVLLLAIVAPVVDTFWRTSQTIAGPPTKQTSTVAGNTAPHFFWQWASPSVASVHLHAASGLQVLFLSIWAVCTFFFVVRFGRALQRVARLRHTATALPLHENADRHAITSLRRSVKILRSDCISEPVTVGFLKPAIILPGELVSKLQPQELQAVLLHESAHIQRHDYLLHALCESLILPFAWHPGIRFLMSKISQTRELACDENAARSFGERRHYARALLHLASLCLNTSHRSPVGIGIFDADNLEDRIMNLTEKKNPLTLAKASALAFAVILAFGCCTMLARAMAVQPPSETGTSSQGFAGTWQWMFHDHSFATMVLTQTGSTYNGTVTGSRIALDKDGSLSKADPSENSAPSPITKAALEGNSLHVTVMDSGQPFEFFVHLKDASHAEIRPVGAPANMKPIQAQKTN